MIGNDDRPRTRSILAREWRLFKLQLATINQSQSASAWSLTISLMQQRWSEIWGSSVVS